MPPKKDDYIRLPNKVVGTLLGTLLSGAIAFNAWAVTAVYARPTEDKVAEMIEDKSPYVADKNMIRQALEDIRDELREVKQLLRERNGADN